MGYVSSAVLCQHDNLAHAAKPWGGYKEYGEIVLLFLSPFCDKNTVLANSESEYVEFIVLKENRCHYIAVCYYFCMYNRVRVHSH